MAEFTRGPANVDDLLTSTMDKYRGKLQENWMAGNIVTKKMMESGNVRYEDGGNSIIEDVEFTSNSTADFVSQTDTLSTAVNQIMTQARFSWKVLAGAVTLGDHDEAKNSGESKQHDLLKVRIQNLENTFKTKMEVALVGGVTASNKVPTSLLDVIDSSDPALGSYGDIARATYTWWAATEASGGSFASGAAQDAIRTAYLTTSRGNTDPVSYHLTTQTAFAAYNKSLQPQERFASNSKGDLEFESLAFANKPVFFSEIMSTGLWLGINQKYLGLTINRAMHFKNRPFVRAPGGQSQSSIIQLMCEVTNSRCYSNFKITSLTA